MSKLIEHEFYCLNCGKQSFPILRNPGHLHEKFHRKKLYCIYCKKTLNFIEIRNYNEKIKFLEKFENGEFKEEAEQSMKECEHL